MMNNSAPLNYKQAKTIANFTIDLFNRYVRKHHLINMPIIAELKETTALFIFSKIYKHPLLGGVEIAKSIFLYPPIANQYIRYYLSVPSKLLGLIRSRMVEHN